MSAALLLPVLLHVVIFQAAEPPTFDCQMLVSADPYFGEQWDHIPPNTGPHLSTLDSAVKGQKLWIYLLFLHYQVDSESNAHVVFDIKIKRPDGETYFEQKALEAFRGSVPNRGGILLGRQHLGLIFDSEDPLGTYTIELTGHDRIGRSRVEAYKSVRCIEWERPEEFGDHEALNKWMMGYFRKPEPRRALKALRFLGKSFWKGANNPEDFHPVFFRELIRQNPFLSERMIAEYDSFDPETKRSVLYLLVHSDVDLGRLAGSSASEKERRLLSSRPSRFLTLQAMSSRVPAIWTLCGGFSSQPEGTNPSYAFAEFWRMSRRGKRSRISRTRP